MNIFNFFENSLEFSLRLLQKNTNEISIKKTELTESIISNFKFYKEFLSLDLLYNPIVKEYLLQIYKNNVTITT